MNQRGLVGPCRQVHRVPMAPANPVDPIGDALAIVDKAEALRQLGLVGRLRCDEAISYYRKGAPSKRLWARAFRVLALLFATTAGLTPIVLPLAVAWYAPWKDHLSDLLSLAAVFAALAVATVAFDRLFGFSSAWMRFVVADLELTTRRDAFTAEWAKICVRAGVAPTAEQIASSLDVLAMLLASVNEIVRSETQSWVSEFRGVLSDLETRIEATRAAVSATVAPARGALEVRVTDVAALDGGSWTLQLGNHEPLDQGKSPSAVVTDLAPGILRVVASGIVRGSTVSAARALEVQAGKVAIVEFELTADRTGPKLQSAPKPALTGDAASAAPAPHG